jgi:hypothetical protein
MTENARCAALLRNGERRRSVAVDGDFCAHHHRLASALGEEAVQTGRHVRRRRQDSILARVVDQSEHDDVEIKHGTATTTTTASCPRMCGPASPPPRRRTCPSSSASCSTRRPATRQAWTTITCKHCERQGRYEVVIPDYRVRLDAVEKLLQQGLGRAREAQDAPVSQVPSVAADVMKLGWEDLQRFAAALFVDALVGLHRRGADALLRERAAALSDDERRVLRTALGAVPS